MVRIGINGFGRIGRIAMRIAEQRSDVEVVAINSRSAAESHALLAQYDSTYGIWNADVKVHEDHLHINGRKVHVFQYDAPSDIPWDQAGVDIVIESTGVFTTKEKCLPHIKGSVKRVVISAPGKEIDGTFVMGVNEHLFDPSQHTVISNASCTTNCLAPVAKVLDEVFGIEKGLMTTIHAFTNDQNILDNSHKKDMRRARTAGSSIIPTSTGAAEAVALVLPQLKGKLTGLALRVPTETVSMVDLTFQSKKSTTREEVNAAFQKAANTYLGVSSLPLVSVDFKANTHSAIVDTEYTQVMDGNLIKVLAWYDNEWGYAERLIDLVEFVSR